MSLFPGSHCRAAKATLVCIPFAVLAGAICCHAQQPVTARTPTTPLVVHDPYFSMWSFDDALNGGPTHHWTGTDQRLIGIVRIDGKSFQFMGKEQGTNLLPQVSRSIWPTHVIYEFQGSGIHLTATFFTPALPQDLDVLSRPLTYLSWTVHSVDGKPHAVELYFAAGAGLAVNDEYEGVVWGKSRVGNLEVMHIGTNLQPMLQKAGDNLRIDWGWVDVAVPAQPGMSAATIGITEFNYDVQNGILSDSDELEMPRMARVNLPVLAIRFDLGSVSAEPVMRRLMLAYDDREAIEFFHRQLTDYWQRNKMTMGQMLQAAEREEPSLDRRAWAFDKAIVTDLTSVGGEHYAQLAILAFQQTLGAHKLTADIDGAPLLFSKEDFSNGCVNTVDVTYPTSPFFLLFNPKLLEALLRPVMEYAELPRWGWPFAPHDIGTYPQANGQVYGGGETSEVDQMPVEESGNMLILFDALSQAEGNAHFAEQYWPLLTRWAEYLRANGLDPANQLSSDDFAGHLTHNANLSIKAILALGSYAQLANMLGKKDIAQDYRELSKHMAAQWMQMAADGDHTRLAFDMPGTWSQKYNLVWDRVLGLNLFPPSLALNEVHFYLAHQNAFGLPLDDRHTYTKLDWTVWSATLAQDPSDFKALIDPLNKYMTETPSRVPLSDWFDTVTGAQVGFQARSVVGGVYIKMLTDRDLWHKWATQSQPLPATAADAK
jgi:Domain of unknown function (DUF4965)/Domain of unknown function (DUF1793)/Domain of unknown function (DUF5127)/Domain of unknown function (DUF4964)